MKDTDTMTNEELDRWWAERMGRAYKAPVLMEGLNGPFTMHKVAFFPSTSGDDWLVVYKWMRGRGWDSSHNQRLEFEPCSWWRWAKGYKTFTTDDPYLRVAMLKAALRAERKGE